MMYVFSMSHLPSSDGQCYYCTHLRYLGSCDLPPSRQWNFVVHTVNPMAGTGEIRGKTRVTLSRKLKMKTQ